MDPVTSAILAIIPVLGTEVMKRSVEGAYVALKAVISRKWGESAPISKAIKAVEADPQSKAQAAVLEEKVAAVEASNDPQVAAALRALLSEMKAQGVAVEEASRIELHISGGTFTGSTVGAENVNIGTMNFGVERKA